MEEKFNDVAPFVDNDGDAIVAIETDGKAYPKYVGRLWLGATWLTVAEARKFRDWLDKVIP